MARSKVLRLARGWGLATALILGANATVNAQQGTDVTFPTNVVPNTSAGRQVQVKARLYLPGGRSAPYALVIISPSSGGVREEREIYYARELARAGIAALVVDSFASRGLTDSVRDQSVVSSFQTGNDAVGAARWAVADGRFKRDRIGVMGVSKGGIVAMNMAQVVRRRWMGLTDITFAAHIPISPDCTQINRSMATTGAPMFFMLAELDDQTPAAPCVEHAERLKRAGNPKIEVKVYKGAHHAWERLGASPYFDSRAQNFSRCRLWFDDDGTVWADGNLRLNDGTVTPQRGLRLTSTEAFGWLVKNCMTLGTHCCGGTRALRGQATADLLAFLKRQDF